MDQYLPLVVTAQQLRMRAVAPQMQQQLEAVAQQLVLARQMALAHTILQQQQQLAQLLEAAAQQLVLARQMALAHTTLQQQQAQGASLREMLHHGHMSRVTCMLSW
jgi:hypothetical protein